MKKILSMLLASVMVLSLAACSNQPAEENSSSQSSSEQTASLETTYPVTITDALGREVTIEEEPERLVSGYYITTSYLAALDLDEKLVGIEAKADTRELYKLAAPELPSLPNVGSLKQFNLETCVSTEPDLVILSAKVPDAVAKLEELGIPVIAVNPESEKEFKETISMIGTACNVQELSLIHIYIELSTGLNLGDFKGRQVLELGREKFDWENRKKEIAEFNAQNKRYKRGMGVSLGGHVNGFYPAKPDYTRVDMCVTESGTVRCGVTLHDHGCGTVTAFKMIAAEELGIEVDQVRIQEGDTAVTPQDFVGCFSSRTTYVMGRATQECAKLLKERIKEHFAVERGCDVADVVLDGMTVYSTKEPDVVYTWSDLVYASQQRYQHEIFASYEYVSKDNPGVCGGHFAYVEVDTYTGMVKILDYLAVQDIGQAINREICIAQTQGASVMGAGAALTEHVHYRPNGVPFANLKDYHLLNSFEAPSVRVELIENHNTEGPFGAKTIGEVCHVPASAAVVGAVNDALQSDLNDLPLTPDKITAYLKNREER